MDVTLHRHEDAQTLDGLIRRETDAKQRDRYRVVQLAAAGEQTRTIMHMLGRSRGFVQAWAAEIDRACAESWNKLTPERLMSITATKWLTHEN